MNSNATVRFRAYGIVQGVGFRPTVARHARTAGIRGSVCNKGPYVEIIAQGTPARIRRFETLLKEHPPRRAAILKLDEKTVEEAVDFDSFLIIESEKTTGEIYILPDIAICEECGREMFDPADRRYLHPFINCTCCGPRMTILDALPYDRERTSMKMFPMCRSCAEEYYGSRSRRYDAQPVCCNDCGPQVYLLPAAGGRGQRADQKAAKDHLAGIGTAVTAVKNRKSTRGGVKADIVGREAITAVRRTILDGGIAAVKGIGGFHLCCDATREEAVQKLRIRKHRPAKPFAVMMKDEETVRRECVFSEEQRRILTGHQKPILLLDKRTDSQAQTSAGNRSLLAPAVAPGNPRVGVMLPYAPLQHLLFTYDDGLRMPDCLVMTSGNVSGAPICRDDEDALSELSPFCDCILSHDRLIRIRADDSIMDFHRAEPFMIRRSRGYAPLPVLLTAEKRDEKQNALTGAGKGRGCVLAVGGELKNAFCIASGNLFYLSPYVGDLEDLRTVRALRETIDRMESLLEVTFQSVVCDLHPRYNATMVAEEIAAERNIPIRRIQHHYAHVLSCMAENDRTGPVIGVSFDGTGFGTDGTIWGGEILTADYQGFSREYSIAPFAQTGGDSAPRQGWRIAASMIWNYCRSVCEEDGKTDKVCSACEEKDDGSHADSPVQAPGPAELYFLIMETLSVCDLPDARVQRVMAERKGQSITSTSAGRLFDGVSAMLGICRESTYEGEASIELEFAAGRYAQKLAAGRVPAPGRELREIRDGLHFEKKTRHLPTDRLFAQLLSRRLKGEDPEKLAWFFHVFLAELAVQACVRISEEKGVRTSVLTGGCYQNRLLLTLTEEGLKEKGFEVLIHHRIPPNDGGIALGQAAAVMMRVQNE